MPLATRPDKFAELVLGLNLHPGQKQWLNARARVKVACCGRRWGKSYSTAADLLWFAICHRDTTQFVVAPTHDQAGVIFGYTEQLISNRIPEYIESLVKSPFASLELKNGSVIAARSAGTSGVHLRGHGADRVVLDEAAYIPSPVVKEVIPPMLADSKYGELALISTPFGLNHFHDSYAMGETKTPGYLSFRFPSSDNPHLDRGYLEQQKREMTSLAYAVEYEAAFMEDQNAVFPWSLIERCIQTESENHPQPAHRYVLGFDPAKWSDRSGVVILDVSQRPWAVVHVDDIAGRDYLVQAVAIETLHTDYHQARTLIDSTSHEQMLEQLRTLGVEADGYRFTNASKQELINGLVIAMEQGDVKIPAHPDLIEELKYYRYETTAAGNVKLGADERHHDDLVTALALAVQAARSPLAFRSEDIRAAIRDIEIDEGIFA